MTNSGIVKIHGKDYMTVAKRVELAHVDGLIEVNTEVLFVSPVVVRATIKTPKGTYTGISAADPLKSIEKSNPFEVAETSAVGRALGFAGYGIIEGIASADEMNKTNYGEPNNDVAPVEEEPPIPADVEDTKVCSAHDEPIQLLRGKSKTKVDANGNPKVYWWHKGGNNQICFGSGYQD